MAVGALMCAVRPALTGWALAGLAIAAVAAIRSRSRASKRGAVLAATLLTALVLVVFVAGCGSSSSSRPPDTIELTAHLDATARYDAARKVFAVEERLKIPEEVVRQASLSHFVRFRDPARTELAITRAAGTALERSGWQVGLSTAAIKATLQRTSAVHQHQLFPGLTANTLQIALPRFLGRVGQIPISLTLDPSSRASLTAPAFLIAVTDPASGGEPTVAGQEQRHIALGEGTTAIAYEARSAAFRNEALERIPSLTLWPAFKWLLLAIVSMTGEEVRDTVKRRLRRLLRGRARAQPPAAPAVAEARIAAPEQGVDTAAGTGSGDGADSMGV